MEFFLNVFLQFSDNNYLSFKSSNLPPLVLESWILDSMKVLLCLVVFWNVKIQYLLDGNKFVLQTSALGDGWYPAAIQTRRERNFILLARPWFSDTRSYWIAGWTDCANDHNVVNSFTCEWNTTGPGKIDP